MPVRKQFVVVKMLFLLLLFLTIIVITVWFQRLSSFAQSAVPEIEVADSRVVVGIPSMRSRWTFSFMARNYFVQTSVVF
jgi:cell division septal protein FtsQ